MKLVSTTSPWTLKNSLSTQMSKRSYFKLGPKPRLLEFSKRTKASRSSSLSLQKGTQKYIKGGKF